MAVNDFTEMTLLALGWMALVLAAVHEYTSHKAMMATFDVDVLFPALTLPPVPVADAAAQDQCHHIKTVEGAPVMARSAEAGTGQSPGAAQRESAAQDPVMPAPYRFPVDLGVAAG
ncbi:hypothetical protein [Fodinicola feengrottensis]|uniref:hypothetical protein n=1 Tax=Fodinicola feengrottensis TaxID=435914 RepID=UPI002441AEC4|nr:hypothetical protein [Fodinicola feengrottensis]